MSAQTKSGKVGNSQNFPLNSLLNTCLRCGHRWRSNKIMGQAALIPPVKCARCRSPLWNTPRIYKQRSKAEKEKLFQLEMDRDGHERNFLREKAERQRLQAEVERLKEAAAKDANTIEALDKENMGLLRQMEMKESYIRNLLGRLGETPTAGRPKGKGTK